MQRQDGEGRGGEDGRARGREGLSALPTSLPSLQPTSSATRFATLMAATRRGWVQPTFFPPSHHPASYRYCGSCVVLPLPVSPTMISTYPRSRVRWHMEAPRY